MAERKRNYPRRPARAGKLPAEPLPWKGLVNVWEFWSAPAEKASGEWRIARSD
jgi:hypothetical protein